MVYSDEFRWRAVALHYIYGVSMQYISDVLGPKPRSISRWYSQFKTSGTVGSIKSRHTSSRWPSEVMVAVQSYIDGHPTFYIEELQLYISTSFPTLKNTSTSTICRALKFDLGLSRKILTKNARESAPEEIQVFRQKLEAIYSYPEQMIFLDETSKDGRHAFRRYAWSKTNTKAVVRLPFSRGKRVSILAAMDHRGFIGYETTPDTFTREKFHDAFIRKVLPFLNPWPLPRSIVVMDNARIHMYAELEITIHQAGARLIFLPPYSPELNPIEIAFGQLKRYIQKYANLVFPLYPELVLRVAMPNCTRVNSTDRTGLGLFRHCGYDFHGIRNSHFDSLISRGDAKVEAYY
jgi:transposase